MWISRVIWRNPSLWNSRSRLNAKGFGPIEFWDLLTVFPRVGSKSNSAQVGA
jgi:hypothetical protein